jgi:hypothetical protein
MTSKDGFSVVAPSKVTVPSSTACNNAAGALEDFAQFGNAGGYGRDLHKFVIERPGEDAREGGFARARIAPENQRGQRTALNQRREHRSFTEQMLLSGKSFERLRPHALGQRHVG